jgi:hypothetical protein
MEKFKTNLDWALYYQSIGLSIIPTRKNKKSLINWKPYQGRCATTEEIKKWWEIWPNANPALVTGKISGVVALDIDIKHNRTSKEFDIPKTACARSGNGGEHFFFRHPAGKIIKTSDAISGNGIDSRGDGGYILLAPSINEKGGKYEWILQLEKDNLAEMPEWFEKLTNTAYKNGSQANIEKKWLKGKDGTSEGSRNSTAASMSGVILSSTRPELSESIGWEQLQIWNKKNEKPLSDAELRNTWESIKKYHKSGKTNQTDGLVENLLRRENIILFHDQLGDEYISLDVDGHQEIWACRSKAIKKWLSREIYKTCKKMPSSEIIKNITSLLAGIACFDGQKFELQNRITWHDNELWYDLTNESWQAIRITGDSWELVDKPPIIFKRYPHNKPQITPSVNGNANLFLNYVNITNAEHRLLLMVFLISCFIPGFPHVMSVIFGPQGSSKSTLAKIIRRIIDPSLIDVASFPHSQRELVQALAHHYFLFFDNVSYISEEQSDTLCKAVTGGGHVKRELYENDEDIIYNFMRCLGLNGINLVTTRPDLLERSLLIELERIEPENRKTEKEIYENFEKDLPAILGGVFDVLVKVLKIQPTIKLNSHYRMADWALWGCAIAEALGHTKEEFLNAYQNNTVRQTEMLLNDNVVATAIMGFMNGKKEWESTPTELFRKLSNHAVFGNIDTTEKYWPKGANSLSRKLNELSSPLKEMNIFVSISTTGTKRFIKIINKNVPNTDETYDSDDVSAELT